MKSTLYDGYEGPRLPRPVQLRRLKKVIENELTEHQRRTLIAYYFQNRTMTDIAREQGVCVSTVCRTLHRAEARVRKSLRY